MRKEYNRKLLSGLGMMELYFYLTALRFLVMFRYEQAGEIQYK